MPGQKSCPNTGLMLVQSHKVNIETTNRIGNFQPSRLKYYQDNLGLTLINTTIKATINTKINTTINMIINGIISIIQFSR